MPIRLLERHGDLEVIVAALDEAAAGRGGAVVVEGPAGIGKTSLLEVAREAARERKVAVASARGSDLEVAYAWGVVRQLFEPGLRGMSAGTRDRVLSGAAALAGPVVLPDSTAPSDVDASFGVLHGLYWLVAALAERRPLLLVVDDQHWADGASTRFLEFMANRLDTLPVLLLAARRPAGGSLPLADVDRARPAVARRDGSPARRGLACLRRGMPRRDRWEPAAPAPSGGRPARARRDRRRGGGA